MIEIGLVDPFRDTVEVTEEVGSVLVLFSTLRLIHQVFDQGLRMDFLLNVDGICFDFERILVLLVLATPNQLRIEVRITRIFELNRHQGQTFGVTGFLGSRDADSLIIKLGRNDQLRSCGFLSSRHISVPFLRSS